MINVETRKAIMTRDVVWLKKSWGKWKGLSKPDHTDDDDDDAPTIVRVDSVAEEDEDNVNHHNPEDSDADSNNEISIAEQEGTRRTTRSTQQEMQTPVAQPGTRLHRELAQLQTYYNQTLTPGVTPNRMNREEENEDIEVNEESTNVEEAEIALISLMGGGRDPITFREAWDHPDPEERKKWREAIRKEFHDMNKRGVWRYIKRRDVPGNRRLIGCKWVFKKKRNGVYRARLVALGYSQIPGVDFTENFSPVVDDVTF